MKALILLLQEKIASKQINNTQLAELLHVSKATMGRKLDGSTPFTLEDVAALQSQFKFSIDALLAGGLAQRIGFGTKEFLPLPTAEATLDAYVSSLLNDFEQLSKMGKPHLYYAAKDLPLFCFFSSPLLTGFKLYFWYITLFGSASDLPAYSATWLPSSIIDKADLVYRMYNQIDSTEIWNLETINSTLHQVEYCVSAKLISVQDAHAVVDALRIFVNNFASQIQAKQKAASTVYTVYLNEILILDNSVLFDLGMARLFYMPIQTLNFITTTDAAFTAKTLEWFSQQIKKSILVSGEAEGARTRMINSYLKSIDEVRV